MKSSRVSRRRSAESTGFAAAANGPQAGRPADANVLDVRDLEAPEPMQRILEACAALAPGAELLARTPRYPEMLLPQLERRGLHWRVVEEPDGSGLVHVRKPD